MSTDPDAAPAPSPWVQRFYSRIVAGGTVLDVAAGSGRHSRLLCAAGYRVVAVDRDVRSLERCGAARTVTADLEVAPWPFAGEQFDGVVVTNYLHRPLFASLLASLAPRGVLIYETFASGQEQWGRPSRPEFLLNPGELLERCAGLHVLAYEDGYLETPRPARLQRVCALRSLSPSAGSQLAL